MFLKGYQREFYEDHQTTYRSFTPSSARFDGVVLDGAHIGDFVKLKEGAWMYPLLAFMVNEPQPVEVDSENLQPKNAPKFYAPAPSEVLPESMDVVIVSRSVEGAEHTTVIGRINTRTGEIRLNRTGSTFDLKGRKLNGKAKAHGAYYGKKFINK